MLRSVNHWLTERKEIRAVLKRSPLGFRSGRPLPAALIRLGTKREIDTVCKTFVPADLAPLGPCSFLLEEYYYRVIRELNTNHQPPRYPINVYLSYHSVLKLIDSFPFKKQKILLTLVLSQVRENGMERSTFEGNVFFFVQDVAARGLDLPKVDCVIQYTGPTSARDYVHRIGRTARAGSSGSATILLTPPEIEFVRMLESRRIRIRQESMDDVLDRLMGPLSKHSSAHNAAVALQNDFENLILEDTKLRERACKGKV